MRVPVLLGQALATIGFAIAICVPGRLLAADELGVFVEFAAADASLNATYQRVMAALPPPARDPLRRAQRAWIAFLEKDVKVISNFTNLEDRWRFKLGETIARREELEAMLQPQAQEGGPRLQSQLHDADRELNECYRKFLTVRKEDAGAAREAQRAWIVYRDENARACRGSETEATLLLTTQRIAQLRKFSTDPVESAPDEEKMEPQISQRTETLPPGRKIPNPFDRAH